MIHLSRAIEDRRVAELVMDRCGDPITSVYDLVNRRGRYPCAIPVLVEVSPTIEEANIREGIVRALATRDARGLVGSALFDELDRTDGKYYRWVIVNTFSEIASEADAGRLALWASNESDSGTRKVLARALGRTNNNDVVPALIELLDDPIAASEAARALAKLGPPAGTGAVERLRQLEETGTVPQRAAAQAALRKIGSGGRPDDRPPTTAGRGTET